MRRAVYYPIRRLIVSFHPPADRTCTRRVTDSDCRLRYLAVRCVIGADFRFRILFVLAASSAPSTDLPSVLTYVVARQLVDVELPTVRFAPRGGFLRADFYYQSHYVYCTLFYNLQRRPTTLCFADSCVSDSLFHPLFLLPCVMTHLCAAFGNLLLL